MLAERDVPLPPRNAVGTLSAFVAVRELWRYGLTVGDIARLVGAHPRAVAVMLEQKAEN